jgi:glutamate synthase (NADPH) large chain
VILGPFGRNLGAGMSGGLAYVFDPEGRLARRANHEMVLVEEGVPAEDLGWLRETVCRHAEATGSPLAERLLAEWSLVRASFRRVVPKGALAVRPAAWPPREAEARGGSIGEEVLARSAAGA